MPKTVLLTGATGFLGSHLLEALVKEGYRVVILKRSTSDTWRIEHLLEQVKYYNVDQDPLEQAFAEQHIDAVFHTACNYGRHKEPALQIIESNLLFGLKILDLSVKFNTDTFFNTDTLLPKYLNIYTLSKKQFVEWLHLESGKIQVVNLKLEHMYGPKDDTSKFVPWVINQLKAKVPEIKLTKGEQKRDFIHVDDVVAAFLLTMRKANTLAKFNTFDVGTGVLVTIKDFVEQLAESYETYFGSSSTQLNFGALPYREGEMMSVEVDNSGLLDLGWNVSTPLKQGIKQLIKEL